MTAEDTPRLAALLRRLCCAFNRPYSPELLEVNVAVLAGCEIADVELRGLAWLVTQRWFPVPVDLLHGPRPDAKVRAEAAWASLRGLRGNTNNDELAEKALNRIGGWIFLSQLDRDQVDRRRADFVALYIAFAYDEDDEKAGQILERIGISAIGAGAKAVSTSR